MIVFDKYHVVKLLLEALNDVRKQVVKKAQTEELPLLTNKKWLLLSHKSNLGSNSRSELDALLALNRPLQIAHLLKEDFLQLCEFKEYAPAMRHLLRWVRLSITSGLKPFMSFAQEVANRLEGFTNHIRERVPMGTVEALNSRLQGLIHRARGFRSLQGFISVARFVCGRRANVIANRSVFGSAL